MSFGRWRQQLAVMLAIQWLAAGASIQKAAADLGYESVPSSVTMFRKTLGRMVYLMSLSSRKRRVTAVCGGLRRRLHLADH